MKGLGDGAAAAAADKGGGSGVGPLRGPVTCALASAKLARRREEDSSSAGVDDVRVSMSHTLRLLEAMRSPRSYGKANFV